MFHFANSKRKLCLLSLAGALALMLAALLACEDDSTCPITCDEGFEVHEWGVMVGCDSDTSFFLTSRPEVDALVRIPVIYVHSPCRTPFTAEVTFAEGHPTDTYPVATVSNNKATWSNVTFTDKITVPSAKALEFVPLADIIETLNSVDGDIMQYDGIGARFLFYEGEAKFDNVVEVSYDYDSSSVTFTNHADYPVYDLIFTLSPLGLGPFVNMLYAEADWLEAGETIEVELQTRYRRPLIGRFLTALGFTEPEAESFEALWQTPLFDANNPAGPTKVFYRLPQSVYDDFISLEITPNPVKTIRTLFVLTHLN